MKKRFLSCILAAAIALSAGQGLVFAVPENGAAELDAEMEQDHR